MGFGRKATLAGIVGAGIAWVARSRGGGASGAKQQSSLGGEQRRSGRDRTRSTGSAKSQGNGAERDGAGPERGWSVNRNADAGDVQPIDESSPPPTSAIVDDPDIPVGGYDVESNEELVMAERDALTVDDGDGAHRRRDQTQGIAAQEIAREQVRQRLNGASATGNVDAEVDDVADERQDSARVAR